ncbi:carbohydrate kinase family protein [Alicyclobacillus tolerans]|uniref:Fructokinase/fructan beta-fructosidase n=1 Tax=Alicyclobacillus tolerans TaxID=90970 RepID=A0A1M6XN13_9BACL|nr:carbohydrate kinase [Alicyclobacillus montanus]SHL07185.1 fructokinase/fructan beta-fructosidase [Alicyclobacillus montanus]
MFDLVAIGEVLIDFHMQKDDMSPLWVGNAGGAPANVLAAASKLGVSTALIGAVGDDPFGHSLLRLINKLSIDTRAMSILPQVWTTLAFVSLDSQGERSFSFLRNPGSDTAWHTTHIMKQYASSCRVLHYGSLTLCASPAREALLELLSLAKNQGAVLSYDPNWRPALWKDKKMGIEAMRLGLQWADVVKVAEEEACLLTGKSQIDEAMEELAHCGPTWLLITGGSKGAWIVHRDGWRRHVPTIPVRVEDSTGAGDTFLGAFWAELLTVIDAKVSLLTAHHEQLENAVRFANRAGAYIAARSGSLSIMPTREQIEELG